MNLKSSFLYLFLLVFSCGSLWAISNPKRLEIPKRRVISVAGNSVLTAALTTDGNLFLQTSLDGGTSWNNPISVDVIFPLGAKGGRPYSIPQVLVGGMANSLGGIAFQASPASSLGGVSLMFDLTNPSGSSYSNSTVNNTSLMGLAFSNLEFLSLYPAGAGPFRPPGGFPSIELERFTQDPNTKEINGDQQNPASPNNIRTRTLLAPCFLAASLNSLVAVAVPPFGEDLPLASVLFNNIADEWQPSGNKSVIPEFEGSKISNTNRIELVGLEDQLTGDLSKAALIWHVEDKILSSSYLPPIEWNTTTLQSDPIRFMGGVSLNPVNETVQLFCSSKHGKLFRALGRLPDAPDPGDQIKPVLFEVDEVEKGTNISVCQISDSYVQGDYGWWLVVQQNDRGQKQLIIFRSDAEGAVRGFPIIEGGLTAYSDRSIPMAVGVNNDTNDVVAIFDITSPSAGFNSDLIFNTDTGPGTYVCLVKDGDPIKGKVSLQKIGNFSN